jgi:4-amino-4-deoxy-L-arabinose transferase-like glycosyltransferase
MMIMTIKKLRWIGSLILILLILYDLKLSFISISDDFDMAVGGRDWRSYLADPNYSICKILNLPVYLDYVPEVFLEILMKSAGGEDFCLHIAIDGRTIKELKGDKLPKQWDFYSLALPKLLLKGKDKITVKLSITGSPDLDTNYVLIYGDTRSTSEYSYVVHNGKFSQDLSLDQGLQTGEFIIRLTGNYNSNYQLFTPITLKWIPPFLLLLLSLSLFYLFIYGYLLTPDNRIVKALKYLIYLSLLFSSLYLHIRYMYLFENTPWGADIAADAVTYDTLAKEILAENNFMLAMMNKDILWENFYPPLWVLFLSATYSIFEPNFFIPKLILCILVIIISLLVYLLGKEVFNENTGIIASLICAYSPVLFRYSVTLQYEIFYSFLIIMSIYFLIIGSKRDKVFFFFLAGIAFGLSLLTKLILLPFIIPIILWLYLTYKNRLKRFALGSFVFLFSTFLLVSLWTTRNYLVYKDLILVNSAGGLNLFFGNNPYAIGKYYTALGKTIPMQLPGLSVHESSKEYFKKALVFIWHNPGRFITLGFYKAYYLWEPLYYQIPLMGDVLYQLGLNRAWLWPYIFLLGGIVITATRRGSNSREGYLLISLMIVFTLGHMIFHGEPRFRVPILPFVYLFYGISLTWIFSLLRAKDTNIPH